MLVAVQQTCKTGGMRVLLAALLLVPALPSNAQDVPLPQPRPEMTEDADVEPPRRRPDTPDEAQDGESDTDASRVYQVACPAMLTGAVEAVMLAPISDGQCQVASPLAVSAVAANGRLVPLSAPATLNCAMATLLPDWVAAIDGYLMARENTQLARVLVGTSQMCRGRNRVAGADISEHGFANALDVIGFELEDGRSLVLPDGWRQPRSPAGRLLRFAHDAGCARFTTTLGPEANALHADHLHLDLGCHGQSCTARLCE